MSKLVAVAKSSPVTIKLNTEPQVATAGVKGMIAKALVTKFLTHLITDPRNEQMARKFIANQNDEFREGLEETLVLLQRVLKAG